MDISRILNSKFTIFRNKKFWAVVIACFLFLIICLFIFWHQVEVSLDKRGEEIIFTVEQGQGLKEIAKQLKDEGLIRSKQVFILYTLLKGKARSLQAGEYLISPSMNIVQIVQKFVKGEAIPKGIKITIPEGFSNQQIEERLIGLGIISEDDELPKELEGYLFPDTYYFEKKATTGDIVKQMLDNFNKKLTSDLREEIMRQGKTIFEVVILASIVQNEVSSADDMAKVAGIFYNRLERGIPLQSDATVNYVTGKNLRQPLIEDTKIESPYNTYLHTGLPPGPISNPGLEAIKAVIYPEQTDYLYFLNPIDGTTIFSKTLEEHNANKRKYFE